MLLFQCLHQFVMRNLKGLSVQIRIKIAMDSRVSTELCGRGGAKIATPSTSGIVLASQLYALICYIVKILILLQ